MGYSNTKRAIRRVEYYLQQLVSADGRVEFPSEDASKLAYYIRDGVKSSHKFLSEGQPYTDYARLDARFIIRVKGPTVSCEPRDVVSMPDGLGRVSIPDVSDELGIIGAAIKHKAPVLVFPDASTHSVDLARLMRWSEAHGYRVIGSDERIILERA